LLATTARPLSAGVVVLALFGGFAFADRLKRTILREPVVFSDMGALAELFRHPELYLAFAGYTRVIGAALAAVVAFAALVALEPPLWPWSPWPGLAALGLVLAVILGTAGPLLQPVARLLRRLDPEGDPRRDAARLGALAMQLAYGVIARAERQARRAASPPPTVSGDRPRRERRPPVVVVQSESFFDARRLHPTVPDGPFAAFDRLGREALQRGRLGVLGAGGNTMRTEFEVLSGLSAEALGFDRLNPYHGFTRAPVQSLAWRLRAEGYRTVCIHPFDRSFYRRDLAMPNLGFERFLGQEAFPADAAREGAYIADTEIAALAGRLLAEEGEGLFLFVVTIANHGPWAAPAAHLPEPLRDPALSGYLERLRGADAMLDGISRSLERHGEGGLLALYGDHLPSLTASFERLGFDETDSDYLIWRAGAKAAGSRRDLAAPRDLHRAIFDAWEAGAPTIACPARAAV
jgi:hypothetical protein